MSTLEPVGTVLGRLVHSGRMSEDAAEAIVEGIRAKRLHDAFSGVVELAERIRRDDAPPSWPEAA